MARAVASHFTTPDCHPNSRNFVEAKASLTVAKNSLATHHFIKENPDQESDVRGRPLNF